jgi:signal transduction histidine kinase
MVEMIDTLLGIHKLEAGKMRLYFKEEVPAALVARSVGKFGMQAKRGNIKLYCSFEEGVPNILVDRNSFARILGNLLSNAIKFTPEGGEIEVSVDLVEEVGALAALQNDLPKVGRFVRIAVRDTGEGIPQDSLSSIFDRFVQARNRRLGKTQGTGLGLAFCKKAINAHGGYIWAESVQNKGSVFTILLPAQPEDGER